MSEPGDLLPLYLDEDRATIRITSGPHDGRTLAWSSQPPWRIVLAVEQPLSTWAFNPDPTVPTFVQALYEPALDELGHRRRADDGALLYEYRGQ